MSYIKNNLNNDEQLDYHSRVSIKPIIIYYISTAVTLFIIFSYIDSIIYGLVASISGMLIYTPYALIDYFGSEFGITAKRVISKRGIISRKVSEMNLDSIESINVDQGILGRILNYGGVKISGRGTTSVDFSNIDDPVAIRKLIQNKN
tara:strand:- start:199 stop:642 length:444 start_codon:yes stop_codon:yes gene_type:complete